MVNYYLCLLNWPFLEFSQGEILLPNFYTLVKPEVIEWHKLVPLDRLNKLSKIVLPISLFDYCFVVHLQEL